MGGSTTSELSTAQPESRCSAAHSPQQSDRSEECDWVVCSALLFRDVHQQLVEGFCGALVDPAAARISKRGYAYCGLVRI